MMTLLYVAVSLARLESPSLAESAWWWQPVTVGPGSGGVAAQVGMTPEVLAAAGWTAEDAGELDELILESPQITGSINSAAEQLADAEDSVRSLAWQVRVRPWDEAARDALAAAESSRSIARVTWETVREQAVESLSAVGPSGSEAAILASINQDACFENPAFSVATRSPSDARALRLAEIHANRRSRLGEPCVPLADQLITAARAVPGYTAAQQGVSQHLIGIKSVLAIGE